MAEYEFKCRVKAAKAMQKNFCASCFMSQRFGIPVPQLQDRDRSLICPALNANGILGYFERFFRAEIKRKREGQSEIFFYGRRMLGKEIRDAIVFEDLPPVDKKRAKKADLPWPCCWEKWDKLSIPDFFVVGR